MGTVSNETKFLTGQHLLERLENTGCKFCEDGVLVRQRYKGNDAVVCDNCETPTMQIWDEKLPL